jgi:tetratricopeptide (TPR) repeat protein
MHRKCLFQSRTSFKRVVSGVKFSYLRAKDAIQSCREAIRVSPNEGRFHYQLARALQKSGQYKAALASYHKAIDHSYTRAYDGAGGLFILDLNDPRSSIPYFKVLAKRNNAHAMFMLAAAYEKIGNYRSFEYWITKGAKNGDPDALAVYRERSMNSSSESSAAKHARELSEFGICKSSPALGC